MAIYYKFFSSYIFWQLAYGIILLLALKLICIPFLLLNTKSAVIPLAGFTYLKGLLYASFMRGGVDEFALNPWVLGTVFSLELLALAFLNERPGDKDGMNFSIMYFISKVAIIPAFIILYCTRITFGYRILELASSIINWVLGLPVIGSIIHFVFQSISGIIVIAVIIICVIVLIMGLMRLKKRN